MRYLPYNAHRSACLLWPVIVFLMLFGCGDLWSTSSSTSSDPTACETYCDLMAIRCTRKNLQYKDYDTCMQTCATFAQSTSTAPTQGDTLQCRMTYLLAADDEAQATGFCLIAGPTGSNTCIESE